MAWLSSPRAMRVSISRRWGGIHFQTGDMDGRALGKVVGYDNWYKAQTFIIGTATAPRSSHPTELPAAVLHLAAWYAVPATPA